MVDNLNGRSAAEIKVAHDFFALKPAIPCQIQEALGIAAVTKSKDAGWLLPVNLAVCRIVELTVYDFQSCARGAHRSSFGSWWWFGVRSLDCKPKEHPDAAGRNRIAL